MLVSLPLACSRECSCVKVEGAEHSPYATLCYFLSQPEPTRSPCVWVDIRLPALVRSAMIQQFSFTVPDQRYLAQQYKRLTDRSLDVLGLPLLISLGRRSRLLIAAFTCSTCAPCASA